MEIAIISDTHDHVEHIKRFVENIKERDITTIIHAGDYCSPFTIPLFAGLKVIGVFGNNDGDHYRLVSKFADIQGEIHNEFYEGIIDGKNLALYHGTQSSITEALILCGKYDLVISGHSHNVVHEKNGKTVSINPGSLHGFDDKPSYAVYDTKSGKIELLNL
ncbi:MAG: metallophosphoesterase [Balneolales bacterium]